MCSGIIESARAALEAGVKVGLGTDSSCPFVTQYDMWREVAYFAKYVGVSNAFALHTATQVNAELLGLGGETGTIGGRRRYLVTRESLDDLCALREPMHVMCRGDLVRKLKVKRIPGWTPSSTRLGQPAEALAEELARDGVA
ncbi:MAG: amidohydrolase family protein [Collinsella sp.]